MQLHKASGILVLLQNESELANIQLPAEVPADYCIGDPNTVKVRNLLRSAKLWEQVKQIRLERDSNLKRLKELNTIGVALSTEKDPVKLFNMILQKSREITRADAGSLYLVEGEEGNRNASASKSRKTIPCG